MEEKQKILNDIRIYQQQLQTLLIQKETFKIRKVEIENALEELNKTKQKSAYKISGNIMILKPIEELKNELKEEIENIEEKIMSLKRGEEKIMSRLKELQAKIKV